MTPDTEAIVAADRAAAREIDAVKTRLDERLRLQHERLDRDRAAAAGAAQARVDAAAAALERDSEARISRRRAERSVMRDARRRHAAAAVPAAVAAYVAIVGGAERQR